MERGQRILEHFLRLDWGGPGRGGNGNWSLSTNWSTGTVPTTSFDAYLLPGSSSDTVTFERDYSSTPFVSLYLESGGTSVN